MNTYYVIIILPVSEWYSKLLAEFVSWGWKVSTFSCDSNPILKGKAACALSFRIEASVNNTSTIRDKIDDLLQKLKIYYFGTVCIGEKTGGIFWSASESEIEIEPPKSVYRG